MLRRILGLLVMATILLSRLSYALDEQGLAPMQGGSGPLTQLELARTHFEAGVNFYRTERWRLARFEFEAAYELSKSPDLLHNLSMVAEKQGNAAEALVYEERYLVEGKLNAEERTQAERRIFYLRELGRPTPPNLTVPTLDSATPPPAAAQPAVTAPSLARETPAGPVTVRTKRSSGPWILLGSGVAVAAVGVGFGLVTAGIKSTIEAGGQYSQAEFDTLFARGQLYNGLGIGFGVTGGALVIAGSIWLYQDYRKAAK